MKVDFAFKVGDTCGGFGEKSPEIKISGIPKGTMNLFLQMKDLDNARGNHGSGDTIPYTGTDTIPYGTLKYFRGPCPPSPHNYQITVYALNGEDVAIGVGKGAALSPSK